jgi:aconitate hydratase
MTLSEQTVREIDLGLGTLYRYYALPVLEQLGFPSLRRMPRSLLVVLESVLRNCDGLRTTQEQLRELASWQPAGSRNSEIPFTVGRVVLNCAAGIPLLGDLTAIRGAVRELGYPVASVGPRVPVDLVLDHTLTVDYHASPTALQRNMELDIERNEERYRFVKWAMQAYDGIRLFPPGSGILHQLNLEVLAPGLLFKDGVCFPDTLVGTDSHTCMIAGLGVVGWGVGGIEAETAVLGHPVFLQMPDVVGVHVTGRLGQGVTATDLVLHVTEMLRQAKVVGKFVEFFGEGVAQLTVPDRATISNMAPEYGATIGYFAVDEQTCRYLRETGRPEAQVLALEQYFRAQGCFGAAQPGEVDYSRILTLNLGAVEPCLAGPKRPQDRVPLQQMRSRFETALHEPAGAGGYGKPADSRPADMHPRDGDVVIAAITSCTNTSNPGVMLAAGLVAKKAVERGLRPKPWVKTSLTPGSQVVGRYLQESGLQRAFDSLGFHIVGYSCATCVGASGPIDPGLETAIADGDVVACAVLSGNRNFEARIHPSVRASFLASPPLVVAFALAGRVDIDMTSEPLGHDPSGQPVYLADLWPTSREIEDALRLAVNPALYRETYARDPAENNPVWAAIPTATGEVYPWDSRSTYVKNPPFLTPALRESVLHDIHGARPLLLLGDSVTTDHISPIGTIRATSPGGRYLLERGVAPGDFNNYGARRMNHDVMIRGAFSNARLKNQMVPGVEGGVTTHQPGGEQVSIFDAAMHYQRDSVPLVIIAGEEYGTGSARDWAAKATRLLGVRAVIASSFERIHRSNLVGMGVLPCQLPEGVTHSTLGLNGTETFDITGVDADAAPGQRLTLTIHHADGRTDVVPVKLRLDTQAELAYVRRGGIMPFLFSEFVERAARVA